MILNIIILISGKTWIYRGIYITYFHGHISSYIDDFIYFPHNKIENGDHQEWMISSKYNQQGSAG